MPLAHDRSLDLLASSPARYHCTTDASSHWGEEEKIELMGQYMYYCHWIRYFHSIIIDNPNYGQMYFSRQTIQLPLIVTILFG